MKRILDTIIDKNRHWTKEGVVASYIPELSKADGEALGICVTNLDGEEFFAGGLRDKVYNTKHIKGYHTYAGHH